MLAFSVSLSTCNDNSSVVLRTEISLAESRPHQSSKDSQKVDPVCDTILNRAEEIESYETGTVVSIKMQNRKLLRV